LGAEVFALSRAACRPIAGDLRRILRADGKR